MKHKTPYLTILTPTYNRGDLLKKCYESLKVQTNEQFQWLIVDDGSTDDTEKIAKEFCEESPQMNIKYLRKTNGGKHTALNYAHSYIEGDYVLILDSDDTLTEDAVAEAYDGWSNYHDNEKIGIVILLKGAAADKPNAYVQDEKVPVDIMNYPRICVKGRDCCEIIRAELFKMYPFPEFKGEKFISEGALWNRVAMTHKCVYINKVIYLCEYLEGGLTKSGKSMRIRNPYGGMYTSNLRMHKKNFMKERIKSGLLYVCYGFFAKLAPITIVTKEKEHRLMKGMCLLPGFCLYVFWKKKYS